MLKNSKYKNTGFLYEILVRQMTTDLLNEGQNANSFHIINKFFGSQNQLTKELGLYRMLIEEKFESESRALNFINSVIKSRKRLNDSLLNKDRYNLVKEVKSSYDVDNVFKTRLNDYKLFSSIYKLFEYDESDDPVDMNKSKNYVLNHVLKTKDENETNISEEVSKYFKDLSNDHVSIAYEIAVDKFNEKYKNLLPEQKVILKEYILNNVNTDEYVKFFKDKYDEFKNIFENIKIDDKSVSIKMEEINRLLDEDFSNVNVIKDKHILSLMKYAELIDELKS